MRILLNMMFLRGRGSAMVGRGILQGLGALGGDHQYLAWIPEQWSAVDADFAPNIAIESKPAGMASKLWNENVMLRKRMRDWSADCLFSCGDTGPPRVGQRHVLLVQQAHLAYARGDWGYSPSPAFEARMALMEQYFAAGLRSIDTFTVQTADMQQNLCARWALDPSRVVVVPSAVPDIPLVPTPTHRDVESQPTVCCVSSVSSHKNNRVLGPMMKALVQTHPTARCVLTVDAEQAPELVAYARQHKLLGRFEFCGPTTQAQTRALLRDATVVVQPSKLESFGLVYYEAMAHAAAIVAADTGSAREACGDAALYAPADDGEALARAVAKLITSKDAALELGAKARQRFTSAQRTWTDVARDYLKLLVD